jgi:hypothetical protein
MIAVNHCIRYLYKTKHLEIKFEVSKDEELTKQQNSAKNQQNNAKSKHVFKSSINDSFVNEDDRRFSYLMN